MRRNIVNKVIEKHPNNFVHRPPIQEKFHAEELNWYVQPYNLTSLEDYYLEPACPLPCSR